MVLRFILSARGGLSIDASGCGPQARARRLRRCVRGPLHRSCGKRAGVPGARGRSIHLTELGSVNSLLPTGRQLSRSRLLRQSAWLAFSESCARFASALGSQAAQKRQEFGEFGFGQWFVQLVLDVDKDLFQARTATIVKQRITVGHATQ